jgi:hypothetical protein
MQACDPYHKFSPSDHIVKHGKIIQGRWWISEWLWSIIGLILTGGNGSTLRKAWPSAMLFTANPKWTGLGSNWDLYGERQATNYVSLGTVKNSLHPFALGILSLGAAHLCQHLWTLEIFLVASTCTLLKYSPQTHFSFCSVPESTDVCWAVYLLVDVNSHVVLNRKTACQQTPSADMPLLVKCLDMLRHCCVGGACLYLPTFEDTLSRQG